MKLLKTIRGAVFGGLLTATLCVANVPVHASSGRVTRGDAMAVFQASLNGGRAIVHHSPQSLGAPADSDLRATIRPFESFDGRHYCVDDWHTIVIADFDGGDRSFKRQDFVESASQDQFTFFLDGVELPTTRTAIKQVNNPLLGFERAFGFQQGTLMAPGELAVGEHSLVVAAVFPSETFDFSITFFIDAAGTGACL